jgi:hypothetical protein
MEYAGQNGLPVFIKILLFGCGILILIVGINNFVPSIEQSQLSGEYPPPNQVRGDPNPNEFGIPYPAPQLQAQSTPIPMFAWPSLEPIDPKSNLPISPSQIADYATYVYENRLLLTPRPQLIATPPSVPVSSLADLPQAIYNLPIVVDNSCIQAKNPGPILPVKSLTAEIPDYYIISFSQNNKPCAKIVVTINNNRASVNIVSNVIGDVYPGVSAEEAVNDVIHKTGLQVKDQPILVYGEFLEVGITLTNPCWQVKTADGQVYYVIFVTSFWEGDPQLKTKVTIMNERELRPIR